MTDCNFAGGFYWAAGKAAFGLTAGFVTMLLILGGFLVHLWFEERKLKKKQNKL